MQTGKARTGIVLYSRSGHSRQVAQRLAQALKAEILPLHINRYGKGPFGFLRACFDSLRQISLLEHGDLPDLSTYDRVILCGPVWTSFPAIPLRDVLRGHEGLPASITLFLTAGGQGPAQSAFKAAEADLGRSFVAEASLPNTWEGTERAERVLARFFRDLDPAQSIAAAL